MRLLTDCQQDTVDSVLVEKGKRRQVLPADRTPLRVIQTSGETFRAKRLLASVPILCVTRGISSVERSRRRCTHVLTRRRDRFEQQLRADIALQDAKQVRFESLGRAFTNDGLARCVRSRGRCFRFRCRPARHCSWRRCRQVGLSSTIL